MYAIAALSLKSKQLDKLNVCWNNVIRKIFHYNKRKSVTTVLFSMNCFNVTRFIMMRKVNFYSHLHTSGKLIVYCATFLCGFCHVNAIICFIQFLLPSHQL